MTLSFSRWSKDSLKISQILVHQPVIILSSLGALCWMLLFSFFSQQQKHLLPISNELEFWLWSAILSLIALIGLSFFFSFLLVFCRNSLQPPKKMTLSKALHFWPSIYLLSLFFLILYIVVSQCAIYGTLFIGQLFLLSLPVAQGVFIFLYTILVIGFAIFFVYAPTILIVEEISWIQALKRSWKVVKHNYPLTLSLSIAYFLITAIVERTTSSIFFLGVSLNDILLFLIIYPFLALLLTAITLASKDSAP